MKRPGLSLRKLRLQKEQDELNMRRRIGHVALVLLPVNVLFVFMIICFVGFQKMALSDSVVLLLIGQVITHAGAVFILLIKYFFTSKT